MQQERSYIKVTDEQRLSFIDLMTQSDKVTILDAAELLQINYESAKQIWTVYKRHGRMHNARTKKVAPRVRPLDGQAHATALERFDNSAALLE